MCLFVLFEILFCSKNVVKMFRDCNMHSSLFNVNVLHTSAAFFPALYMYIPYLYHICKTLTKSQNELWVKVTYDERVCLARKVVKRILVMKLQDMFYLLSNFNGDLQE